jgi:hypothetical protein
MLEDGIDRLPGDVTHGLSEPHHGTGGRLRWRAAKHQQVRKAADRVSAAAKPEQENPVAGLVVVDDKFVTVGDVALDAGTGHRSKEFLDETNRGGEGGSTDIGAEPRVVENYLLRWIDGGVGVVPRNPVHLVDIR